MDTRTALACFIWALVQVCSDAASAPKIEQYTLDLDTPTVMTKTVRTRGTTPILYCSAQSDTKPLSITVHRERTGEKVAEVVGRDLVFTFDPLQCVNMDTYVCTATNRDGSTTARMELEVTCPLEMIPSKFNNDAEALDWPYYTGELGRDVVVKVDVKGSPPPYWLTLTTVNTGRMIVYRDLDEEDDYEYDFEDGDDYTEEAGGDDDDGTQTRFQLDFVPAPIPYGSAVVVIKKLTSDDLEKVYRLAVNNGVGPPLLYTFFLGEAGAAIDQPDRNLPSAASGPNIPAIALGAILLLLLLLMFAGMGFVYRKRYGGFGGGIRGLLADLRLRSRQRIVIRDGFPRNEAISSPSTSEIRMFFGSNTNNSTANHQRGLYNPRRPQKPSSGSESDERFSKEYQPQDKLTRPQSVPQQRGYLPAILGSGENAYVDPDNLAVQNNNTTGAADNGRGAYAAPFSYTSSVPNSYTASSIESSGAGYAVPDRDLGGAAVVMTMDQNKFEDEEEMLSVYATISTNEEGKKQPRTMPSPLTTASGVPNNAGPTGMISAAQPPRNQKSKDDASGDGQRPESPDLATAPASNMYDYPPSSKKPTANGLSPPMEWVVPGQHRKLSLPKPEDETDTYSSF